VLVLFDLLVALGAWAALRKLERLRSAPAVAAQVNDAQNTLVGFGIFLIATTVVLVLLVLEQRRLWQWRRRVFDLGAGTLLDVDGARLAGLSEARISVRTYEPTAAARAPRVQSVDRARCAAPGDAVRRWRQGLRGRRHLAGRDAYPLRAVRLRRCGGHPGYHW
jgi:hypothetical protein